MTVEQTVAPKAHADIETPYSWVRLVAAVALGTLGGVGMWSYTVALPAVQSEFATTRAWAALPYTASMLGFGIGGILMGRLSDRFGILVPVVIGTLSLSLGYIAAGLSQSLWQFTLAQGILIGLFGSSAVFGPLMVDVSRFFSARRGLAVGICAAGNYMAGMVWPPTIQYFFEVAGWRATHIGIGVFCLCTMLPLVLLMRRPPPEQPAPAAPVGASPGVAAHAAPISPNVLMLLLVVAGFACCMAMSMPQVHLVAYCGDLGYGPARGAEMLALMMAMGIVSRMSSGWVCDRIGGLATLLIGSILQAVALLLYVPFTGLASLYVISALFGLFQGGIVPSYAIIVREHFPVREAGERTGIVLFFTLLGMAVGAWASGKVFDHTGSYQMAFVHGIAWNLLNLGIVVWLLLRLGRPGRPPLLGRGLRAAPA